MRIQRLPFPYHGRVFYITPRYFVAFQRIDKCSVVAPPQLLHPISCMHAGHHGRHPPMQPATLVGWLVGIPPGISADSQALLTLNRPGLGPIGFHGFSLWTGYIQLVRPSPADQSVPHQSYGGQSRTPFGVHGFSL